MKMDRFEQLTKFVAREKELVPHKTHIAAWALDEISSLRASCAALTAQVEAKDAALEHSREDFRRFQRIIADRDAALRQAREFFSKFIFERVGAEIYVGTADGQNGTTLRDGVGGLTEWMLLRIAREALAATALPKESNDGK